MEDAQMIYLMCGFQGLDKRIWLYTKESHKYLSIFVTYVMRSVIRPIPDQPLYFISFFINL